MLLFSIIILLNIFSLELRVHADSFIQISKNPKLHDLENVFVHRDAWFNICDFAYIATHDPWARNIRTPYNPASVPAGSIIFVTCGGIEKFLEDIHPQIQNPYILVTLFFGPVMHMSRYIHDPKIIAWFGQANGDAITFEKFSIIPLGVLSRGDIFAERTHINAIFKELRNKPKPNLLYMNFTIHPDRGPETEYRQGVYNLFKDKPFCTRGRKQSFLDEMRESAQHKFILSPKGDMYDCYRHWEALLVGSIPIVQSSALDAIFEDLPIIIVDDYAKVNEEFLDAKYQELQHKSYNLRKLYMQYWVDKINTARSNFFNRAEAS